MAEWKTSKFENCLIWLGYGHKNGFPICTSEHAITQNITYGTLACHVHKHHDVMPTSNCYKRGQLSLMPVIIISLHSFCNLLEVFLMLWRFWMGLGISKFKSVGKLLGVLRRKCMKNFMRLGGSLRQEVSQWCAVLHPCSIFNDHLECHAPFTTPLTK